MLGLTSRRNWSAITALAVLLLAIGCDAGRDSEGGPSGRLAASLCDAAEDAENGDVAGARARFDDVHARLHVLADGLAERDRRLAAELLRAKQRVESGLSGGGGDGGEETGEVADGLAALATVTARAEQGDPAPCA